MKANAVIGWLLAVVFAASASYLFSVNSKQGAELSALRPQAQQAQELKGELDTAKATIDQQTAAMAKLQKDSEDVLRLRSEVKQLTDGKAQLNKQLQAAQNASTSAQQQAQQLRDANQQLQAQQAQKPPPVAAATNPDQQRDVCISQLRQIDSAIQQWALEKHLPDNAPVTPQDILPYLPGGVFPKCPGGGTYTLGTAGQIPICSIPGHALQQQ